jgi:hypothetical protein
MNPSEPVTNDGLEQQVRALLQDPRIVAFTTAACALIGVRLYEAYPDVMFASLMKQITAAGVSPDQVLALLDDDTELARDYVVASVRSSQGIVPEQEYPPGCEPDEESDGVDDDAPSKHLGMAQDFAVRNLLCFWLLTRQPDALLPYFQAIRTPHAKRAAAVERTLFESLR